MDEIDRLLSRVKHSCFGMLPLPVYRRIYETAAARGGGTFVEIGTAQGAATIAMALGAKASGKAFRILTVDKFVGSRPRAGSPEEKLAIVRCGFETFGVADSIENVVGTSADLPPAGELSRIDLLLIDADGQLDRDLARLHSRLAPDSPLIVDDVDGTTYLSFGKGKLVVDQKHRISRLLLDRFIAAGLFVADAPTGQTGWFRNGPASLAPHEIELLALPAYRELIYARPDDSGAGLKHSVLRIASVRAPWLKRAWDGLRGKRAG